MAFYASLTRSLSTTTVTHLTFLSCQVSKYEQYLRTDALISHQLDELYQRMLEMNLLKIVHPYSCVEISHVAKMINLPQTEVS